MNFTNPTPRFVGALCFIFACLFIAPATRAATNAVRFDFAVWSTSPVINKQVKITPHPNSFPRAEGDLIISVDPIYTNSGTAGTITISNMVTGTYIVEFTNRFRNTRFEITLPSTNANGVLTARELTTSGTNDPSNLVAYSQAAANSIFLRAFQISTNGVKVGSGFTNLNLIGATGMVSGSAVTIGGFSGGGSGDSGGTNARQFGSLNLTNWSLIPTGEMANVVAVNFLTNWANSISNYVDTASSNRVRVVGGVGGITVSQSGSGGVQTWTINDDDVGTGGSDAGGTNARQFGTLNLTNWSNIPTGAMANVVAADALTNAINTASNRSWAADSWNTNRVNAAVTNNHTERLAFNTSLSVVGFTNMGSFYATDSSFAGTDAVIKKLGSGSQVVTASLTVSGSSNLAGINNLTANDTINSLVANSSTAIISNTLKRGWHWLGFNTNLTLNWAGTNHYIAQPSNTLTLAFANTPSAGSLAQEMRLEIYNSNASSATVVFPSSVDWGSNASPVYLSGTNHYVFRFNGTNLYGFSGQVLTTGSGETNVLSVSPALVTPTINGAQILGAQLPGWSLIPTGAMANVTAATFLSNAVAAAGGGILTNSGSGTNNTFTNPTNHGLVTIKSSGNARIFFEDTNTALSVSFQAAMGTLRSNLNIYLPTNGMGGNHAGIWIGTNAGGGTNVQNTLAAIGSGLALSSDGKTLSATASGSSSFNSTNLYVSNSAVVVADLANFDRLKVYAISNGTIHLSNASSFLKRGRALIQQSTNGLAAIAWSVPGGLLQTNVNIGNNTNANALDVLEFEQSFFETNLFAWWPSNFLPRVAFTNSLAAGGGGGGGYAVVANTAANGTTTSSIDTSGATLIVVGTSGFANIGSLSDSKGNTWEPLTTRTSTNVRGKLWWCVNPVVGSGHTFTTSGDNPSIAVAAFSGNEASPFDDESGAGSHGTTQQPGSITPAQSNELFVEFAAWYGTDATASIDGSWTILNQVDWVGGLNVAAALAWKVSSSAANPTWTLTEASYITASQAAFK